MTGRTQHLRQICPTGTSPRLRRTMKQDPRRPRAGPTGTTPVRDGRGDDHDVDFRAPLGCGDAPPIPPDLGDPLDAAWDELTARLQGLHWPTKADRKKVIPEGTKAVRTFTLGVIIG